MSVMKRRTLLALVAVAVVLFGLTLNSCKDCNSGKNRGKGKDPLGSGSSEDNLGNGGSIGNLGSGSSTNNSGGKDKDPSGSGSSADNSNRSSTGNSNSGGSTDNSGNGSSTGNSADKNNPAPPPKGRGALTPEEKQAKLNKLKAELVAAAEVVIMNEDDDHKSLIVKIKDTTYNYENLYLTGNYGTAADEEKWFCNLYWMCLSQIGWANYLKEACEACNNKAPEDDNEAKDKENANDYKLWAEDMEEKGRVAAAKRKDDIWNKLEPLLEPAKQDWKDLLAAEEAYRNALRGKFKP